MLTLATGANGFIGSALCEEMRRRGYAIRGSVRSTNKTMIDFEIVNIGDLNRHNDWGVALRGVECVVHLAAHVHVTGRINVGAINQYRTVNVEATINLAEQAAALGVRRFIYLSSIKVNGESTQLGRPFGPIDEPRPQGDYANSKLEAENALQKLSKKTGMEIVIIRPPLVYGPRVKANFETMIRWIYRGIPLPFLGVTKNRRSLVAIENLVDLIIACLIHPAAANQILLVSDGEDISTAEILRRVGMCLGKPARLFYMPKSVLKGLMVMIGMSGVYQRLYESLQVDIDLTEKLLNWTPPIRLNDSLQKLADNYLNEAHL